ncbi:hypothetical protein V1277_001341 [Bradyrhizobium sp. AZCC 1588]|uniref:hypothetical protein n=1 Tax=unclassified Bradyrhizobium TaxID=2631580 RepID=UPI002FF2BFEE
MRSVGKQARDESGKHPVNEDGEEILARVRVKRTRSNSLYRAEAFQPSLRAKRLVRRSFSEGGSNPFHRITDRWIASSRSLSSGAHSRDPVAPRNEDSHLGSKTQMPGTKPGHHVVFVIVSKKPYA